MLFILNVINCLICYFNFAEWHLLFYLYYFVALQPLTVHYKVFLINLKGLTTAFSFSTLFVYMRRLDALFFCGEPAPHSGLEYILQRFYSLMRFRNESVFTEIFLKRIKGQRWGIAHFSAV